jgi:hypothetical protein
MILRIDLHGRKRDGEQLASHSEQAAEFQHRIGDAATVDVDHQILDIAQVLPLAVDDLVAGDRAGGKDVA